MGRIDEALRRSAHARTPAAAGPAGTSGEAFVSPWAFRDMSPAAAAVAVAEHADIELPPAFHEAMPGELHGLRKFSPEWLPRLVVDKNVDYVVVEQFRQLAATLHQAQADHKIRVLMVTSAEAGEGKSLTTMNLALTLSESYGRRVLLIDADLRRPSLHEITRVPNTNGLGETLKNPAAQKLPVYRVSETLMVAPAGRPEPNPMGALTSPRMRQMLSEASTRFDWVLLDAPPVGPIADASLLSPLADGVILVVRAGQTHYARVRKAADVIGRERILGVVLNDADLTGTGYRSYYYAHNAEGTARK
jgi:capsular exopolysaccharide synthesis family protein